MQQIKFANKTALVRKGHKQQYQTGAHLETLVSIWTVFWIVKSPEVLRELYGNEVCM